MPSARSHPEVSTQLRRGADAIAAMRLLVGFDGFVDTILHVVGQRESATKYTRVTAMRDFAEKIADAAGHSANFELVTQMVKLGGNGPIMANALRSFGAQVTYIGNLGAPNLHPVFADFARSAAVHSIAEPGYTDAIEFDDGKLMCGKHQSLKDVNWKNLLRALPENELIRIFSESSLIAMVNWTMLVHMTDIWSRILSRIAPGMDGEKRWMFFDLADPAKRSRADIAGALKQISRFQKYFRVILGMNLRESTQVGDVLGLKGPQETCSGVAAYAAQLRAKLKVEKVVIHPTHFAAAADSEGTAWVDGPFTATPRITTGAGDHFNAGFCVGRLSGCDLASSLHIGVATSGIYVREAHSPTLNDVCKFLSRARVTPRGAR